MNMYNISNNKSARLFHKLARFVVSVNPPPWVEQNLLVFLT